MEQDVVSYTQEVREIHPTQTEVGTMFNFEDLYTITCEEYYSEDLESLREEVKEDAEG